VYTKLESVGVVLVRSSVLGTLSAQTGGGKRVKRLKETAVKRVNCVEARWLDNRRGLR